MAHHSIETSATETSLVPARRNRGFRQRMEQIGRRELAERAISDFAAVQHRRLAAAGCTGRAALRQVALTSDLEGILGRSSPLAVTKLEGISNLVCLGIAGIIQSTMERLEV